jgi:DNA mismatch repair protein MLH3
MILDPPVPILLTKHEKLILRRSDDIRGLLASWGVEFAPVDDTGEADANSNDESNYSQVTVTSIPEIVGHRVCEILTQLYPGLTVVLAVFGG